MRITAESVNDRFMLQFKLIAVWRRILTIKNLRLCVNKSRFTVHIWQKQKPALNWRKHLVHLSSNRLFSQNQCHWILRKCRWRMPINVPRELVQHDDFCESAFCFLAPGRELSPHGLTQNPMKAVFDLPVEFGISRPPLLWFYFLKPEIKNLAVHFDTGSLWHQGDNA